MDTYRYHVCSFVVFLSPSFNKTTIATIGNLTVRYAIWLIIIYDHFYVVIIINDNIVFTL